jgi:hypothetical protein
LATQLAPLDFSPQLAVVVLQETPQHIALVVQLV